MRTRRGLAALAVTALAAASWAGARAPAAAARPFARPADTPLARPAALVLVGRLGLAEALDARPRGQAAMVAGFVSTLPEDQPDAARVLSLAAGRRVDLPAGGVAPGDPAAADRLRAANPDARFGGLPPLRVLAAPGAEAAGLLALGPSGPAPAAEPLPATGTLRLRPDRLLVVAVPGAAGLRDVLARIGGAPGADGVVVVGLRPAPGRARAAPFLGLGGRQAGLVTSASTRRTGLVAFEDLRPTLAGAGAGGDGTPIHLVADPGPAAATASVDRRVAALVLARTWAVPLLAVVACLALLALLAAARRGRAWTGPARALVALTLALPAGYLAASMAEPPAARVWRHASPPALGVAPDPGALAGWAAAWVGCGVAVALLLAAAALRLGRPRGRPEPPLLLGGALLLLVATDLVLGGDGLAQPLLGGSAFDGERFYGLGNGYFAFALAAATLVVAFSRLSGRGAAALLAGLAVVDGLPWLGADVGGALTAMLTAAAALLLLGGARPRPGRVAVVVAVAVLAALALAIGAGLLVGPATHGSRFADRLLSSPGDAARLLLTHLGRNLRLLLANPFSWAGPVEVAVAAALALRPPPALPARVGQGLGLGAIGATLLILLNDTGVTATAASGLVLLAIPAWAWLRAVRSGELPATDRPPTTAAV